MEGCREWRGRDLVREGERDIVHYFTPPVCSVVQNKRRFEALEEDARVASQPLARYKDNSDLHEHMKDRDRDGDPMAAYIEISKKKEKKRLNIKG